MEYQAFQNISKDLDKHFSSNNELNINNDLKSSFSDIQKTPLSPETQERLQEKGFPKSVIEKISSEEEAAIYESANLEAKEINGKDVLVKTNIDLNQTDIFGRTNLERMELGLAPLDSQGMPIELHHIGQDNSSPLAELTRGEHRGKGNDAILHTKTMESRINREVFAEERSEHWKARAAEIKSQQGA